MTFRIITGDCIEAMQDMDENSVDAIVTDPPYGLEFMGKEWDRLDRLWDARKAGGFSGVGGIGPRLQPERNKQAAGLLAQTWHQSWATEALRILKPGAHLLSFGGTRTYHRLTCALEDAGFEIRDCLAWLYGSGFPKSLDVSKAIDKAAGAEREVVGVANGAGSQNTASLGPYAPTYDATAPATPDAERWQGWGTALKPAYEPIVLARKPLSERNVASNVQRWGTGALNIDGCRIETEDTYAYPNGAGGNSFTVAGDVDGTRVTPAASHSLGRWPANLILDETAAAMLDEQTGELASGTLDRSHITAPNKTYGARPKMMNGTYDANSGGASRFFYVPKADREERNRGVEHPPAKRVDKTHSDGRVWDIPDSHSKPRANDHPTVKPVELMQWLCRMVTPPHGLVLDPFLGSGSTGMAALREGFEFVGIEREPDYVEIARARIIGDAPLFNVEEMA